MEQQYCILDYETRSEAEITKTGAFEYSRHPSTQVLCASWMVGTRKELVGKSEVEIWSPAYGGPPKLFEILSDPSIIKIAHNAFFEQVITKNVLGIEVSIDNWLCTASLASTCAIPRNLEGACLSLNLPHKKDMEGKRLMMKMCKPRRSTKNNSDKWHNKKSDLKRLMVYCAKDTLAERDLFLNLPPLIPSERQRWELDQKINFHGFKVDRSLIEKVLRSIKEETIRLDTEITQITNCRSARQTKVLKEYVNQFYPPTIPDLRAKTIIDTLKKTDLPSHVRRVLEIRQMSSRTSTAKYEAFEMRSRSDGRVRDHLVFHAASTGRWSGAGVQVQNFPRGSIKDTNMACKVLEKEDLEGVRLIYGNPMEVFSSCARAMIIPTEGMEFFCGDYASIETRVLFWIAGHTKGLTAYRENRDLYIEMAQFIYGKDTISVDERQMGKRSILGCGYGMGFKKFQKTCEQYGENVSEELAKKAVYGYRELHSPVPEFWKKLENAAIAAVKNPSKRYKTCLTWWEKKDKFLTCRLPSGRFLYYYNPTIKYAPNAWGEPTPKLHHWGMNGVTKKWEETAVWGGLLTENVVQAVARDFMAEAMTRIDKAEFKIVLSVHDELLVEAGKGTSCLEEFLDLMKEIPPWGTGCPIKVEGWSGERYRK